MKFSTISSVSGLKKLVLISFSVMILSACGGGKTTQTQGQSPERIQEIAVQHISASTTNNTIVLNVEDYKNAGVVGVTAENLSKINGIIEELQPRDVDTLIEIQAIVNNAIAELTDTSAPVITLKGQSSVSIFLGDTYSEAGVTITDNRDSNIKVVITGSVNTNKVGTYTLTYTATDKAGNKATKTRTVTVVLPTDTVKPVISLVGESTKTINLGDEYTDAGATAIDNRDSEVTVVVTGQVDTHAAGTYTITYNATDLAENKAVEVTRVVTVVPKIIGDTHQYAFNVLDFSSQYGTSGWSASQALGVSNTTTYGDHSTAWTTSSSSNAEDEFITVGFTKAVYSTGITIRETYGNGYVTKVEAIDLENNLHTVWSGVDPSKPGDVVDFVLGWDKTTYSVVGIKLHINTAHSRGWEETDSIQLHGWDTGVVIDRTAPVITLNGNASIKVGIGSEYTDAGATASDDVDGDLEVTITGSVDTSTKETYTLTYTATDAAGNTATKTRTVKVEDITKPVITLNGSPTVTVIKDGIYTELNATATDNVDGSVSVTITGAVDTSKVGIYTLTYTAKDLANNISAVVRTVKVFVNSTINISTVVTAGHIEITWSGLSSINHRILLVEADKANTLDYEKYINSSARRSGNAFFDIDHKAEVQHLVIAVSATDSYWSDRIYISDPFIIKKLSDVPDTKAPVITLNGPGTISLAANSIYTDAGATATDDRDENITIVTTGTVNTAVDGSYDIVYTAQDSAGNTATKTRTIIIETPRAFITTWKTDNEGISDNNQVRIDTKGSGYDFTVDWGDGDINIGVKGRITHTYSSVGVYTIKITGQFPYFENADNKKLLSVEQWGSIVWGSMKEAFDYTPNLVINATDAPNLSDVTDMSRMFYSSVNFNQNINHWNVSHVVNMKGMFEDATLFNQPLDSWDVSKVTNMQSMFDDADAFNQPIGNWDVSSVTNMTFMFYRSDLFNQPIGSWDVSKVTSMNGLFSGNPVFNQDITSWDVSNVTTMVYMFRYSSFNQPIGNWVVSNVLDMEDMFSGTTAFNQDISNWDVSNVVDMNGMFYSSKAFNQPIGSWDVSNVSDMGSMFKSSEVFNQDLNAWNVQSDTKMLNMFSGADAMDNFPSWYTP